MLRDVGPGSQVRHVNGTRVEEPVITLEASIWYYMYELAANNAAAAVPCAKLVWLLRNPLPHARSLYFHVLTDAPESLTGAWLCSLHGYVLQRA